MKTLQAFLILTILSVSAICQPLLVYGVELSDEHDISLTANEIHQNEVLITWEGDFHADDLQDFVLSISEDGQTYRAEEAVAFQGTRSKYSQMVKTKGKQDLYYKLSGRTHEGKLIPLKTIMMPGSPQGIGVIPLKSNHLIYFTTTEACDAAIFNETGEEVLQIQLKKGMQPVDISSYDVGKYQIKCTNKAAVTISRFERI